MQDTKRAEDDAKSWTTRAGRAARAPLAALMALGLLAGCATPPPADDPDAVAEFEQTNDPIEPFNRAMFDFNLFLDDYFLTPVAKGYRWIMPEYVRDRVTMFMANLTEPVTFGNDLLQGEFSRAGTTLVRFATNTTVGIGGLYDPAGFWGVERHREDFGQTLGSYGVAEGPYLVLPFFGPAPPRDAAGKVVDLFMDPANYVGGDNAAYARWSAMGLDIVNSRANNLDIVADLRKTSLDFYAAVRSLYRQNREAEIANGKSKPAGPGFGASLSPPMVAPPATGAFTVSGDAPEGTQTAATMGAPKPNP
jgi:phospholipid-binding lipoprotein MlaA